MSKGPLRDVLAEDQEVRKSFRSDFDDLCTKVGEQRKRRDIVMVDIEVVDKDENGESSQTHLITFNIPLPPLDFIPTRLLIPTRCLRYVYILS